MLSTGKIKALNDLSNNDDNAINLGVMLDSIESLTDDAASAEAPPSSDDAIVFVPSDTFPGKDFIDQLLRLQDEVRRH